jgi:hypothetical protein
MNHKHAETWAVHEFARRALRELIEMLDVERIDALPVKGILVARTLYRDVCERPISDVDLRVRAADVPRILRLCRARCMRLIRESKQGGAFELYIGGTLVEFETTIGPPGVCAVSVDEMLRRAVRTSERLGFSHLEPELHDHALILCVNAFKDKLRSALPHVIIDIKRIAEQPGFDSARMAELAGEARLNTAVWLVADWLVEQQGSEVWRDVQRRIGRVPPRRLYASVYDTLSRRNQSSRVVFPIVARAASDDPVRCAHALLSGGVGSVAWTLRKLWAGGRVLPGRSR